MLRNGLRTNFMVMEVIEMKTLSQIANLMEDSDSDNVTLVRRQIVYSEIVISKDKFKEIQGAYNDDDLTQYDELLEQMETDEVMKDLAMQKKCGLHSLVMYNNVQMT